MRARTVVASAATEARRLTHQPYEAPPGRGPAASAVTIVSIDAVRQTVADAASVT